MAWASLSGLLLTLLALFGLSTILVRRTAELDGVTQEKMVRPRPVTSSDLTVRISCRV